MFKKHNLMVKLATILMAHDYRERERDLLVIAQQASMIWLNSQ